jgi:hypothetical protein
LDKDSDVQSAKADISLTQIQLQDNQPSSAFLTLQKRERSQREVSLKKVWVIIASKYCKLLLFSVTTHFPVQDLGAAQTHRVLDPCYAGFDGHLAQNMHSKTQSVSGHHPSGQGQIMKERSRAFVLPAIRDPQLI